MGGGGENEWHFEGLYGFLQSIFCFPCAILPQYDHHDHVWMRGHHSKASCKKKTVPPHKWQGRELILALNDNRNAKYVSSMELRTNCNHIYGDFMIWTIPCFEINISIHSKGAWYLTLKHSTLYSLHLLQRQIKFCLWICWGWPEIIPLLMVAIMRGFYCHTGTAVCVVHREQGQVCVWIRAPFCIERADDYSPLALRRCCDALVVT